ncbi:MAG: hypothetical protein WC307_05985 [Candidatus Nanoarchaeia archaeon]|jgi:hypothetical protein
MKKMTITGKEIKEQFDTESIIEIEFEDVCECCGYKGKVWGINEGHCSGVYVCTNCMTTYYPNCTIEIKEV